MPDFYAQVTITMDIVFNSCTVCPFVSHAFQQQIPVMNTYQSLVGMMNRFKIFFVRNMLNVMLLHIYL